MTRKDYCRIASVINHARSVGANEANADKQDIVEHLARVMCVDLAEDNPRFDKQRFLQACGVE